MLDFVERAWKRRSRFWRIWRRRRTRRLYNRDFSAANVRHILDAIDAMMKLPDLLEREFHRELVEFEEAKNMRYVTSHERIGIEQGLEQGIENGIEQGRQQEANALIVRMARKRFAGFGPGDERIIAQLPLDRLEALAEALLDFAELSDLRQWFAGNHFSSEK